MQALPPSPGKTPPGAGDSALNNSWSDPANMRARVLRLEQQRLAVRPEVKPILPAPPTAQPARRTIQRPLFVAFYVMLLGLGMLLASGTLVMLLSDTSTCVRTGYRETCGTFGEIMAELTLVPAQTWALFFAGIACYQLCTVCGLWLMRPWGWWLAVIGLVGNFVWTLFDMGVRVFLIWTVSALCLRWFYANRWRFDGEDEYNP